MQGEAEGTGLVLAFERRRLQEDPPTEMIL